MQFLDASPTAYQATHQASRLFEASGFKRLDERESWNLESGTGYFVIRNQTTIIAFRTGTDSVESAGLRIVTAHTDSPAFKLKPRSESNKNGAVRLSVEVYGGPIYHTWVDRPLAVAGSISVVVDGSPVRRIYAGPSPVAIIPNAALHLNREMNKGFAYNPQDHLKPVFIGKTEAEGFHLIEHLSRELGVEAEAIVDFDLFLCDRAPALRIGLTGDLLVSGRLDNLAMCHAAAAALCSSAGVKHTQLAVLFDNEEVGSRTYQGANSSFLRDVIERVTLATGSGSPDAVHRALASSAMVSGDAAHAVHPSYADKHDEHYQPVLNGGPVIKISAGQRYTTTAHTAGVFERICDDRSVAVQRIISRADMPSGGTVGPVVSSRLGIPSLDIGHPIWAMHSIRETGGAFDHGPMINAMTGFFESEADFR